MKNIKERDQSKGYIPLRLIIRDNMKKIIISISLIITIVAVAFAILEVDNYYKEKKKIDDNTMIQEIEEKIKKEEELIKQKLEEENKIKEENKEKFEELETWQKKVKEMEENL